MKTVIYILSSILFFSSCNGQQKDKIVCSSNKSIKIISELDEVKKQQRLIDSITRHTKGVSYMIENEKKMVKTIIR
jgi:hypothetical protein